MAENPQEPQFDVIEETGQEITISDVEVDQNIPMSEEEAWAYKILKRAATLKGVTIKRDEFLRTCLAKKCPPDVVAAAVETTPLLAGVSLDVMDELADAAISLETRKVSGLSALAGLPGGLALFGTIPADLVQYFAHALRIEQKLAYLYGWESFLNDDDEVDDETMYRLIMFLGVMMQVGSVSSSLVKFATQTAKAGVKKAIERQALTKTAWYTPLKQVLRIVGVKVTKTSFAEVVSKGVPILGGVVSGGITYASFYPGAVSLKRYLRTLPQATGVVLSNDEMEVVVKQLEEESKADFRAVLGEAGSKVGETAVAAKDFVGAAAVVAKDRTGAAAVAMKDHAAEVSTVAREKAGIAAKAATAGLKKGFGGLSSRLSRGRTAKVQAFSAEDAAEQLRAYKQLLDEGLIDQDDYDAKKRELLDL